MTWLIYMIWSGWSPWPSFLSFPPFSAWSFQINLDLSCSLHRPAHWLTPGQEGLQWNEVFFTEERVLAVPLQAAFQRGGGVACCLHQCAYLRVSLREILPYIKSSALSQNTPRDKQTDDGRYSPAIIFLCFKHQKPSHIWSLRIFTYVLADLHVSIILPLDSTQMAQEDEDAVVLRIV